MQGTQRGTARCIRPTQDHKELLEPLIRTSVKVLECGAFTLSIPHPFIPDPHALKQVLECGAGHTAGDGTEGRHIGPFASDVCPLALDVLMETETRVSFVKELWC